MISKELLSEILGRPIEIISIDENKCEIRNSISFENYQLGVSYIYLYGNKETRFMPIHELAHKCKEWAGSLGKYHCIYSGLYDSTDQGTLYICLLDSNDFWADTEPEAIFKACEWILGINKDEKCK